MKSDQGVLGIFTYLDTVTDAVKELKNNGYEQLKVFSPFPNHEIEDVMEESPSQVRYFTLFGGLLGATCGFGFTVLTAMSWPIPVSAKPVVSIIPFMVIVFELTILFGALSTLIGLLINSFVRKRAPITLYDPRFSDDKFGIMVVCPEDKIKNVESILKSRGAEEVKFDTVEY